MVKKLLVKERRINLRGWDARMVRRECQRLLDAKCEQGESKSRERDREFLRAAGGVRVEGGSG